MKANQLASPLLSCTKLSFFSPLSPLKSMKTTSPPSFAAAKIATSG